jgi:hypothetical protein
MRCARVVTSPAFDGSRVLAAILFEQTMERDVNGVPTAQYLWEDKGRPVPQGRRGSGRRAARVRLMKPIDTLDELFEQANRHRVSGTKMRSMINDADKDGISAIADQQFEYGARIAAAGLVPILEPEVGIDSPHKGRCRDAAARRPADARRGAAGRRAHPAEADDPDPAGPLRRAGRRPARAARAGPVRRLPPRRGVHAARPGPDHDRELLPRVAGGPVRPSRPTTSSTRSSTRRSRRSSTPR